MASWTTASCRTEAIDRDPSFYFHDMDTSQADMQNDFFGQFIDFDAEAQAATSNSDTQDFSGTNFNATGPHDFAEPFLMGNTAGSTGSSGGSTTDDFDFLSSSSNVGPPISTTSHDIDPKAIALGGETQLDHLGRGSISDTEISRLEDISLYSPQKNFPASHPASPTPPNSGPSTIGAVRKQNRFVEAVSSTIRKATNIRKPRKALAEKRRQRSPSLSKPSQTIQHHKVRGRAVTQGNLPVSPPLQQGPGDVNFIHGHFEDPFSEFNAPLSRPTFTSRGVSTPNESPPIKLETGSFQADPNVPASTGSWSQGSVPATAGQQWSGPEYVYTQGQDPAWWQFHLMNQSGELVDPKNASVNMVMHSHQAELPYEYSNIPDTASAGLMIQMPQPRAPQSTVANDLSLNANTYLPPHPAPPPIPATERPHRPPRAPSSGARHLSCSPTRKNRAPSASPTRNQGNSQSQTLPRSRHSSGASVSSVRSASGRLPGSMPGTPCSVRKRRSRDISGSGSQSEEIGGGGGGGGGAGGGVGFVNFTPSDGGMLMTGVAPSGSSKTKARREKEATERRRRLSEAAMKAVAAAGGDVDKLIEQGFTF